MGLINLLDCYISKKRMTFMKQLLNKIASVSIVVAGLAVAGMGVAIAASPANVATAAKTTAKTKMSLLSVLLAESGDIRRTTRGGYTLTLSHVDPRVLWFSDRPYRRAGFVSINKFIANWKKAFKTSPPNAAMVHVGMSAKAGDRVEPMAMELMNPNLRNDSLSFNVKVLKGDRILVGHFKLPSIYVDGGWSDADTAGLIGGIVDATGF